MSSCPSCDCDLTQRELPDSLCPECGNSLAALHDTVTMPADASNLWDKLLTTWAMPEGDAAAIESHTDLGSRIAVKSRALSDIDETGSDDTDFELIRVLGKGGMGTVYEARQTSVDRIIALKMMKPDLARSAKVRAKFLSEAVVTGDLDHPNIVPIYDVGVNDDGRLFYAMKYVKGVPWKDVMQKRSVVENIEILLRVADAVAFAHSRTIIHRDLKPENVMLGDYGEVLVMDWGMAVSTVGRGKAESLGNIESIGGTPAYMPPEMAKGDVSKIGPGSDIYLLGAILYEILTGRPPHDGTTVSEYLQSAVDNEVQSVDTDLEGVGELVNVALTSLKTNVDERFENVQAFQTAVRRYLSHAESIIRTNRATKDLARAKASREYDDFVLTLFGFREALSLWTGNREAETGELEARYAYAECAYRKGDYDLASTLLSADDGQHAKLLKKITKARDVQRARKNRLSLILRLVRGLVFLILLTLTIAIFWIKQEKNKADAARIVSENARNAEVIHRRNAEHEKEKAIAARIAEEEQRKRAEEQRRLAEAQRVRAEQETEKALAAQLSEIRQREKTKIAEHAIEEARDTLTRQSLKTLSAEARAAEAQRQNLDAIYIATLALINNKIKESAFYEAEKLLSECPKEVRNWEWGRFRYLCRPRAVELSGHIDKITAVNFSENDSKIITASLDNTVKLWDATTGDMLGSVRVESEGVRSAVFVRDGNQLVVAGGDGSVNIWDAKSGDQLSEITGPNPRISAMSISPDGEFCIAGYGSGDSEIWRIHSRTRPIRLPGHRGAVTSVSCSADKRTIVTGSRDRRVRVWETPIVMRTAEIYLETNGINAAVEANVDNISPIQERRELANPRVPGVVGMGNIEITYRENTQRAATKNIFDYTAVVTAVTLSPRGDRIFAAGEDNMGRMWDTATGELLLSLTGHTGGIRAAVISPNGRRILTGSDDGTARVWETTYGKTIMVLPVTGENVTAVGFSATGNSFLTGDRVGRAILWSMPINEVEKLLGGHTSRVTATAFFRDGRRVITGCNDGTLRIWDYQTGRKSRTIRGVEESVVAVFVATNSSLICSVNSDRSVNFWDSGSGAFLYRLNGLGDISSVDRIPEKVREVAVSRNNEILQALALIDSIPESGKDGRKLKPTYSPDGSQVLINTSDRQIQLWDALNGNELFSLEGHTDEVVHATFSPDGRRILTAGKDKTAKLWSTQTGLELVTLNHGDAVHYAEFSSNGRYIISSSDDGNCMVWQADNWDSQ